MPEEVSENEDEIERDGNVYIAVDRHIGERSCCRCAFVVHSFSACNAIKCCDFQRKDGRNVIFVEKQK